MIILSALLAIADGSPGCLGLEGIGSQKPGVAMRSGHTHSEYDYPEPVNRSLRVEIVHQADAFRIYRGGEPYYIKGIGGRDFLESAAAAGANSIRTWGPRNADALLDRAQRLNMTVMVGIWLSHHASDYTDPLYKKRKMQEVQLLVEQYKNHPALLMWSLGNEINLEGADTRAAWRFVEDLARTIKLQDANHPVIAVIACKQTTLNNIASLAPSLDAVGINAYGTVTSLRAMVDHSRYNGPYLITEWGVNGHWEALKTSWGRPIEPTGTQKAEYHLLRYANDILANSDKCIGSYVFLWGQKQERTPTWYSMFLDDLPGTDNGGVSLPSVDAMYFNWSGRWPVNRAPQVLAMMINDVPADSNIILYPGEPMISRVEAGDPENDPLSYVWELLEEPTFLGTGGSHEPKPKTLASVRRDNLPVLSLRAPLTAGEYRLFVYVLDHNGHAGTANIPFQVREIPTQSLKPGLLPPGPG
jgi:hypothetical protein